MSPLINLLLKTSQRQIYHLYDMINNQPAVFLILDKEVGGILVNTPSYNESTKTLLDSFKINYIFLPSHFGAIDTMQWKNLTGAKLLAHENATHLINDNIDFPVNEKTKLTRTIDFLPIAGRSPGSCGLFLKNLPGIIFFGPTLQRLANGWPGIVQSADDFDFEARLFSSLNLKDLKFQYAFTDDFDTNKSLTGPEADIHIRKNIESHFD